MDTTLLARIAAIVFVAIALTFAGIEMTRKKRDPEPVVSAPPLEMPADPLRTGQRRCQQLGEAAADDAVCLQVWGETRDRFLGRTPAPTAPLCCGAR